MILNLFETLNLNGFRCCISHKSAQHCAKLGLDEKV